MTVTEQDRERAEQLRADIAGQLAIAGHAGVHAWPTSVTAEHINHAAGELVPVIAHAIAAERERERSQWNPMVGRVLAVAQEWHRNGDSHGQQIFDAIEGNAK